MKLRSPTLALCLLVAAPTLLGAQSEREQALGVMMSSNDTLRAQGMDYMVQQMDLFEGGQGLASVKIHKQEHRWVPGDARRGVQGRELSYLVTASGWQPLPAVDAELAVDRAVATWASDKCLDSVTVYKLPDGGEDATLFDALVGDGGFGDPFVADVVVAGFLEDFSSHLGEGVIAATVTYVFVDGAGQPTDLDQDGYFDTAHTEVYLNPDYDWRIDAAPGDPAIVGYDVESAVLHDLGHALSLGHVDTQNEAVMNPGYDGIARTLRSRDHAGLCAVYQGH